MYQETAAACKLDEMLGFLWFPTALRLAGGANCSGTDKKKSQPSSALLGKVHTARLQCSDENLQIITQNQPFLS